MPTLLASLRALPRPVWILFAGTFINRFGTFVMPFLAIYMTREGYSTTQAGVALSTYGAGHVVAAMAGGHLADRIGRRNTIVLSMFASAMAMIALTQVHTLPATLAVVFIAGMVGEMYRPAATALIGDLVAPEQRMIAFGMYRWAINLGFACGPAVAGFLADRSFVYVFLGDGATSLVYGFVALFALPHGLRSSGKDEKPAEGLRVALNDRMFMLFLLATLFLCCVEFQTVSTFPVHITKLGYSPTAYGMLLMINGIMIVTLELILTAWAQRFPAQPLIALGYALSGIGLGLTGIATGFPMLAATVVIWTLGEMIYAPVTSTYVTALAPERFRGRYMGLWHSTWSAGMLIGPALGTILYERSPAMLWTACGVAGVASAAIALVRPKPAIIAECSGNPSSS